MEIEFEPEGENWLFYECTVEEIGLEGLDGITIQALFERLLDKGCCPISRDEGEGVKASLWEALKRDERFKFYILPEPRPPLKIWNRNLHHDARGNIMEPDDAPEDIYKYKSVEVKHNEDDGYRIDLKRKLAFGRKKPLSRTEVDCIKIGNRGETVVEGIRVVSSFVLPKSKDRSDKNKVKISSKGFDALATSGMGTMAVRGSCPTFNSRKDVTKTIRQKNVSYSSAFNILGRRMVIVASQFLRETMLFQSANQFEVSGLQYCVVERVGRARQYGEQARGKISLGTMGVDAKSLFYIRKVLLAEGIISKQPLCMKFGPTPNTLISVFHLPHFFRREDTPEDLKVRKIFAFVCNAPQNCVEYTKLVNIFGKHLMKALLDDYKDFVRVNEVPYLQLYPEELEKETKEAKKESLIKRKLRVLTLQNENLTLRQLIQKQLSKQEPEPQEEGEDGEQEQQQENDDDDDARFDWTSCYVPERELAQESELCQLIRLIINRGSRGISMKELSAEMGITSLDCRSSLRYITRWKIANTHMEDVGKTKATRWTYFKCEPKKEEPQEEEVEEDEQILGMDTCLPESPKKKRSVWKSKQKVPGAVQAMEAEPGQPDVPGLVLVTPVAATKDPLALPEERISRKKKVAAKRKITSEVMADLPPPPLVKRSRRRRRHLDHVDEIAFRTRERQRADWSDEQDRLLLYLFITSVLFIPRYNYGKVFVYNVIQLRNLLHRKLPETKSKTTTIIRRRVHNMFKSPSFLSKYKMLLHLTLQDEELYAKLIQPHLPPPSLIMYHKVSDDAMDAVADYIMNKFDQQVSTEESDNFSSAQDVEKILDAREVRRLETIWTDVWANVFHRFYESKTLTMILPIGRSASQPLISEGPVMAEQGPSWARPFIPASSSEPEVTSTNAQDDSNQTQPRCIYADDQLDFAYEVAMTLASTAERVVEEEPPSSCGSDDDEAGSNVVPSKRRSIRLCAKKKADYIDLCAGERNAGSTSEISIWTSRTIFMSTMMGGGGGTTYSLKAFMHSIPDLMLDRVVSSLRTLGVYTMIKPNRKLVLTNFMKRKLTSFFHPNIFRAAYSVLSKLARNTQGSALLDSIKQIGIAYLLSEIGPLVTVNPRIPSSVITVKDELRRDCDAIRTEGTEEVALRLLRLRLNADNDKTIEKDFFELNLPQIQIDANQTLSEKLQFTENPQIDKINLEHRLLQLVDFDEDTGELGTKRQVPQKYAKLFELINLCGNIGVSINFLLKYWDRNELENGLNYLLDHRHVHVVGIRDRKFMSCRHVEDWSLYIPVHEETGAPPKRVILRTWVDAYGEVNWKLIDRAIVRLLGLLHRHSQIMLHQMAKSLSPLLCYVEVLILIQALIDLHIVDIFYLHKHRENRKFGLFSTWEDDDETEGNVAVTDLEEPYKSYAINPLLDIENAWIELLPFHISKYSRLQAIILPTMEISEDDFDPEDVEVMEQIEDPDADQEDQDLL